MKNLNLGLGTVKQTILDLISEYSPGTSHRKYCCEYMINGKPARLLIQLTDQSESDALYTNPFQTEITTTMLVSKQELKQIMPFASSANLDLYLWPINNALGKYEITSKIRIAHFLAQIAHESGCLRYNEEIWNNPKLDKSGNATSGSHWQMKYQGNKGLGNTEPGDGYKYRGRGLIMLTGRSNYEKFSFSANKNFMNNPERVSEPSNAAEVAGWFWDRRNLNALADMDDFIAITKKINGGTNGLEDRAQYLERAKKVLLT